MPGSATVTRSGGTAVRSMVIPNNRRSVTDPLALTELLQAAVLARVLPHS